VNAFPTDKKAPAFTKLEIPPFDRLRVLSEAEPPKAELGFYMGLPEWFGNGN
jgi:hypothetical protein